MKARLTRRIRLIDTNNIGPIITNSLPRGRAAPPDEIVAGISLGMAMSGVVERWGKPSLIWGPYQGSVRFGYRAVSLTFAGDRLKEIHW